MPLDFKSSTTILSKCPAIPLLRYSFSVYTEKEYRSKGIAGHLLNMVVDDLKSKGIMPIYLITDHTSFYERYGWEFLCMVQDEEKHMTRMYIHR